VRCEKASTGKDARCHQQPPLISVPPSGSAASAPTFLFAWLSGIMRARVRRKEEAKSVCESEAVIKISTVFEVHTVSVKYRVKFVMAGSHDVPEAAFFVLRKSQPLGFLRFS
jgi:hypothetical protein